MTSVRNGKALSALCLNSPNLQRYAKEFVLMVGLMFQYRPYSQTHTHTHRGHPSWALSVATGKAATPSGQLIHSLSI